MATGGIQIQHLLKLNISAHKNWFTLRKIQIQHLLKLNFFRTWVIIVINNIQIQHLLKLNEIILINPETLLNSNTTLVKVK